MTTPVTSLDQLNLAFADRFNARDLDRSGSAVIGPENPERASSSEPPCIRMLLVLATGMARSVCERPGRVPV